MRNLHPNINRAAAFIAAAPSPFSLVAIAARLLAAISTRRGVDCSLGKGRRSLGQHLRDSLGGVLRQCGGYNLNWQRGNLHTSPHPTSTNLASTTIERLWHKRGENTVNCNEVNAILNKNAEMSSLAGSFIARVQS
jgi:hypothetical protein